MQTRQDRPIIFYHVLFTSIFIYSTRVLSLNPRGDKVFAATISPEGYLHANDNALRQQRNLPNNKRIVITVENPLNFFQTKLPSQMPHKSPCRRTIENSLPINWYDPDAARSKRLRSVLAPKSSALNSKVYGRMVRKQTLVVRVVAKSSNQGGRFVVRCCFEKK